MNAAGPVRDSALLILVKYPEAGAVKTRLSPLFSPEDAACLARAMAEDLIEKHRKADDYDVIVCCAPPERYDDVRSWLGDGVALERQEGNDLGARQHNALKSAFEAGYRKAAVMGSDVPLVTIEDVTEAFGLLEDVDVVIGPSDDGGYYLLGAKAPHESIFSGISWGDGSVFGETTGRVAEAGLEYRIAASRYDIDSSEDAERLWAFLAERGEGERPEKSFNVLNSIFAVKE